MVQPRLKQFEVPLGGGFYLAVEIESLAGQITQFVVRLMKAGFGRELGALRYRP